MVDFAIRRRPRGTARREKSAEIVPIQPWYDLLAQPIRPDITGYLDRRLRVEHLYLHSQTVTPAYDPEVMIGRPLQLYCDPVITHKLETAAHRAICRHESVELRYRAPVGDRLEPTRVKVTADPSTHLLIVEAARIIMPILAVLAPV